MSKRFGGSPYYPASTPRRVEGGVKARTARGAIGTSWWSKRFIEAMESLNVGGRLQRGRAYARKGQVVSLELQPGTVTARVQGSRASAYRVRIGITAFGKAEWAAVEEALAGNAWYVAKLLAGEMPEDIEDVFAEAGLSLFPRSARDLSMDCSCPDWEVPCKHLAAVFYLLGERFDEDPFQILAWRGRERDEILERMQLADGGAESPVSAGVPLTDVLDSFYVSATPLPRVGRRAPTSVMVLDQLPPVDVKVRSRELTEVLRPVYEELRGHVPVPNDNAEVPRHDT